MVGAAQRIAGAAQRIVGAPCKIYSRGGGWPARFIVTGGLPRPVEAGTLIPVVWYVWFCWWFVVGVL